MKRMSWTTIILFGMAAFAAAVFAQGLLKPQDPGTVISAPEAHEKAAKGEIVLVDIRTPQEWQQTGIPASAWAITMNQDGRQLVAALEKAMGGDKTRPLAIICRTGNRTTHLQGQLKQVGFTNVLNVAEGVAGSRYGKGWLNDGLPLRRGADITKSPVVAQH